MNVKTNQNLKTAEVSIDEPLMRVEEVAELLNVKPQTIYTWAAMDYIPCVRIGMGTKKPAIRFDRSAVLQWLEDRKRSGRLQRVQWSNN